MVDIQLLHSLFQIPFLMAIMVMDSQLGCEVSCTSLVYLVKRVISLVDTVQYS